MWEIVGWIYGVAGWSFAIIETRKVCKLIKEKIELLEEVAACEQVNSDRYRNLEERVLAWNERCPVKRPEVSSWTNKQAGES